VTFDESVERSAFILAGAVHLSAAGADAILAANEELLGDGEVSIAEVTEPIDVGSPPGGLAVSSRLYSSCGRPGQQPIVGQSDDAERRRSPSDEL
jgi:hypothetical protein